MSKLDQKQNANLTEMPFEYFPALFGASQRPGLVAAFPGNPGFINCWWRVNGQISFTQEPFRPYLWLSDKSLLQGLPLQVVFLENEAPKEISEDLCLVYPLSGLGKYKYLVEVANEKQLTLVSKHITSLTGSQKGDPFSPQLVIQDLVSQFLMKTGITMFTGLKPSQVKRLKIFAVNGAFQEKDLTETFHMPLEAVGMIKTGGQSAEITEGEVLLKIADFPSEKDMLLEFVQKLQDWDPDIIESHKLYNQVLPYLEQRFRANKIPFNLGRRVEGSPAILPSARKTRLQIAEKSLDYYNWTVYGRNLADTWILAQMYDVSFRTLESYGLADVNRALGGEDEALPVNLPLCALISARKVDYISRMLSQSYFVQTQIFPYSYQNTILRGSATRINSLFLREYLRCLEAVPSKPRSVSFAGGLTQQDYEGLAYNVLHCDVQSLYPSIMLAWKIGPKSDTLNIFLGILEKLRTFRLEAKAHLRKVERDAEKSEEANFYNAMQTAFKILINSFYGYLGFAQGNFADYDAAAAVTEKGRQLLTSMINWLKNEKCSIIEVDTDGIYFVPSYQVQHLDEYRAITDGLNAYLPEGINVELDGFYRSMYCHKMKNYALLEYDGKVTLRGSALRNRGFEPFLQNAVERMITLALQGRKEDIPNMLLGIKKSLEARSIPISSLASTQILSDSPENYQRKLATKSASRSAAFELAVNSGKQYRAGEAVTFYITGTKAAVKIWENSKLLDRYDPSNPDENIKFYVSKLNDLKKKFPILFS